MHLPPTPPDDRALKNPATPPANVRPLTPDSTPPGMRRALRHPSNDLTALPSQSAERHTPVQETLHAIDPDQVQRDGKTPEVPGAYKEAEWESYIPIHDDDVLDHHNNAPGQLLPVLSPASKVTTLLGVNDFAVRQKPRKRARKTKPKSHQPLFTSSDRPSGDWNDVPPDMTSVEQSEERLSPIKTSRMDVLKHGAAVVQHKERLSPTKTSRTNALKHGSAVEVVVLQTQSDSRHALRHVKKRRSLRSVGRQPTSTARAKSEHVEQATSQHTLKHRKAFEPTHQSPQLPVFHDIASSAERKPTLRHERRPLSSGGHSPSLAAAENQLPLHGNVSLPTQLKEVSKPEQHILRHVSPELRLEKVEKKDTFATTSVPPSPQINPVLAGGLSPSIKSHRFANTQTPLSILSDRTEMELCMAKNVSLFPHSNDSVFLIENSTLSSKKTALPVPLAPRTFRPLSLTFEDPESVSTSSTESLERTFSTPEIRVNGSNVHAVDSPLTNPRAAPLPPAIKFIPPTPSSELDRQLSNTENQSPLQRNDSLINKARRLSGSLITPFFPRSSVEHYRHSATRSPHVATLGNDRLHPMWLPTNMWEDDDYSDTDDDFDPEAYGPLPAGGDTSEHPTESRSFFPRQMSVRMPGFRGNGGFLLGNSLGVERHGTNRRRHHVELPGRTATTRDPDSRFTFFRGLRERVRRRRAVHEDAALEKRRMQLKDSIGVKIMHQGAL